MQMMGYHHRGRNLTTCKDRQLIRYGIHTSDSRFGASALLPAVEAMEKRLCSLMPNTSNTIMDLVQRATVRGRCLGSTELITERGLILNMGLSSAYASPCHCDMGDLVWCTAFSCKCAHFHRPPCTTS